MNAFDSSEFEKHKAEAKEKWGSTDAYKEHAEKTKNYSKQKWNDLAEGMNSIMAAFARFKDNIDKHADGTAEFVCAAIAVYCRTDHKPTTIK